MLKRIKNFCIITIKASPGFFAFNLIMLIVFALSRLGMDLTFKVATEYILASKVSGRLSPKLAMIILFFFIMVCIGGNTWNFTNMMNTLYTNKAKKLFGKYFMFRSYQEKQDRFYDSEFYNNYEFVKKNINNTTQISITVFNNLVGAVIGLIISGIAVSYFSPIFLIIIFTVSGTMVIVNRYVVKVRTALDEEHTEDERRANYYSSILSTKPYAKELRIFKLRDFFLGKWQAQFRKYSYKKYQFEKKATILSHLPEMIEELLSTAIILYFLYRVNRNELAVSNFVFLYRIMWSFTGNISSIIQVLTEELSQNYKYIKSYEEFTGKVDKENLRKVSHYSLGKDSIVNGEFNQLVFDQVTYRYPVGEKNAVENLSFTLRKGEVVCLLGYNGSGKSTLSKLMCGILEDYGGSIRLNGMEISKMNREELYRYFGIGFQDFAKYSISLKENVGIGMVEKLSEDWEINKAMEKGNLKELVDRLPKGTDTILGKEYDPEGQDLSGGQWQRIILSRAYMGEPEILILDEPTASVDPIEEMRIIEYFRDIVQGKTALLISHRIGFARISDRICIMENGRIIEDGTHEELMNLHGRYYELFMSQKELYNEEDLVNAG